MGQRIARPEGSATTPLTGSSKREAWNDIWHEIDSGADFDEEDDDSYLRVIQHSYGDPLISLADLEAQTHFNRRELTVMLRAFRKECPAGEVSEPQFQSYYSKFFPGDSQEYSHYVFLSFSRREPTISFQNFIKALSISTRGTYDERVKWSFSLYDIDGDGFISENDMLTLLRAVYKMVKVDSGTDDVEATPELMERKLFKLFKKSGAGISQEDFLAGCTKNAKVRKALQFFEGLL